MNGDDPDRTLPFEGPDESSEEGQDGSSEEGQAGASQQGMRQPFDTGTDDEGSGTGTQPTMAPGQEEQPASPAWLEDPSDSSLGVETGVPAAETPGGTVEQPYQPGMTYETESPVPQAQAPEAGQQAQGASQQMQEQALIEEPLREEGSSGGRRGRRRAAKRQATDLFLPMFLGVVFGFLFLLVWHGLFKYVVPSKYLYDKLLERGTIPYVCTIFLTWHLSHVLFRYFRRIRPEFGVLSFDLVPASASEIMNEDLQIISQRALEVEQNMGGSLLTKRLLLAVAHLGIRRDTAELGDLLRRRAEADRARAVNAYAIPNFLFWAIPILGFVGTVLGVGLAVGGLKSGLTGGGGADVSKLGTELGKVTEHLGVAFDTTLVALIMSIAAYLVQTLVRQQDARLLADVEDYLTYRLQSRISTETSDDRMENIMRESLDKMEAIQKTITQQNMRSSQLTMQTMMNTQQSLRTAIDKFPTMLSHASETSSRMLSDVSTTGAGVLQEVRQGVGQLVKVLTAQLSQSFQELVSALEGSVARQAGIGQEIARNVSQETTAAAQHLKTDFQSIAQELAAQFRQMGEEMQESTKGAAAAMADGIASVGEEARSVVSGVGNAFLDSVAEHGTEMFRGTAQEFHQAVAPLKTFLDQAVQGLEKAVTEGQRLAGLQESLDRNLDELVRVKKVDEVLEGLQFTLASLRPMLERLEEPAPLRLSLGGVEIPVSTGPRL